MKKQKTPPYPEELAILFLGLVAMAFLVVSVILRYQSNTAFEKVCHTKGGEVLAAHGALYCVPKGTLIPVEQ